MLEGVREIILEPGLMDRCVAYHEAGHAVMRHRLGWTLRAVSIVPKTDRLGHVRSVLPTKVINRIRKNLGQDVVDWVQAGSEKGADEVIRIFDLYRRGEKLGSPRELVDLFAVFGLGVMACMGGMIAQVEETGLIVMAAYGASVDLETAKRFTMLAAVGNQNLCDVTTVYLENETRRILKQRWVAVRALAEILIKERNLSGKKATAIITTALSEAGIVDDSDVGLHGLTFGG